MLRNITYKITAMFLLVPFLAASTGLSIYFHECSCEQRIITTLFVEHKCHEEQVSSCSDSKQDKEINYSDASCGCKTIHLTLKVNDLNNTNPTVLDSKIDFTTIYRFVNQENCTNLFSQDFIESKNLYVPDDSPPIKPAGRILINFLHQSKTPAFCS